MDLSEGLILLPLPTLEKAFGNWVKEMIFKGCHCIFTLSLSPSLEKGHGPSFEQMCFVTSFVEFGPVVMRKKMKMCRV